MGTMQSERPSLNFHKYYDSLFVVVKKSVLNVFYWLYEGGTDYVGDYLKYTPGVWRKLGKIEKTVLNRKEKPSNFDISLLYMLLQNTCGLAVGDIWCNPQTPSEHLSLEHTLFRLKTIRNTVCHEPQTLMQMSENDLQLKLSELRNLCRVILQKAGLKSNKSRSFIDSHVHNMEKEFDDIQANPIPSGITAEKFALVAKIEMKKYSNIATSINNIVQPHLEAKDSTGRKKRSLKTVLSWKCKDGSSPSCILLIGETGTGKSTVCRYIHHSWISINPEICNLQDFDLVVPVNCCNVSTRDVIEFLKEFLSSTISWCGRDDAQKFLGNLRVLWLVDGFEESTVDGRALLKKIQMLGVSHLVLITLKPQYQEELTDFLTVKNQVCEVTLTGLDLEGVEEMSRMILSQTEQDPINCERTTNRFLNAVANFGMDIVKELETPLKLELMLNLWIKGKLGKEVGASLYLLYKAILDMQIENLYEKIRAKSTLKSSEIKRRINLWTAALFETAFNMIMENQYIRLNESSLMNLEDRAGNLPVNPEDCLSIFLQSEFLVTPRKLAYCFVHNTQQYFLSARHICQIIDKSSNPADAVESIFHKYLQLGKNERNHYHLYMVLLHVVSGVATEKKVKDTLIIKLINLLSNCNTFDVFEVIQYAAYVKKFTEVASKFANPEKWIVTGNRVKAAKELLLYTSPFATMFVIRNEYLDKRELVNALKLASAKCLMISLELTHYLSQSDDVSDQYVAAICAPGVRAMFSGFTGYLSLDGCHFLLKMQSMINIALKITSNELLEKVLFYVKRMRSLKMLTFNFEMPVIETKFSLHASKLGGLLVVLEALDESCIDKTAQSICNIFHTYYQIFIKASNYNILRFILILISRGIRVDQMVKVSNVGMKQIWPPS